MTCLWRKIRKTQTASKASDKGIGKGKNKDKSKTAEDHQHGQHERASRREVGIVLGRSEFRKSRANIEHAGNHC